MGAPVHRNSLTDAEILRLIGDRSAVNYQTAARIAEVGLPQVRKLIRQKKLVGIGEGRFSRKVTVPSLLRYAGIVITELHGTERNRTEPGEPRHSSTKEVTRAC